MAVRLKRWDTSEHLRDQEDFDEYLRLAVESNDPQLISMALGNIAKAQKRLGLVAQETGLNKAGVYRSFTQTGKPTMENFFKVAHALGYGIDLYKLTPEQMTNFA